MGKPNSYHVQDGCHNCLFVLEWHEYDCGVRHFCQRGAPLPRPPCQSVAMGELSRDYLEEGFVGYATWDDWSEGREVRAEGICDHHSLEKGEKKPKPNHPPIGVDDSPGLNEGGFLYY